MTDTNTQDPLAQTPSPFADFLIPEFEVPSDEEIDARRAEKYNWSAANLVRSDVIETRTAEDAPARFNILSLPAWLSVARRAGVPYIAAREIASMSTDDFTRSLDEDTVAFRTFHKQILSNVQDHEMIRMEQVAPAEIKVTMSDGSEMTNGLTESYDGSERFLDLHEERFYTTLLDLGEPTVRAYARPVTTPRKIQGVYRGTPGSWPVEFRVFVEGGEVVGISNYYPQVGMDKHLFHNEIADTLTLARKMVSTMNALKLGVGNASLCPDFDYAENAQYAPEGLADWTPEEWDRQDYTLDFMLKFNGDVVFLEGGPAGMRAAHPCCFLQDGRDINENFLKGVALSVDSPVLDLEMFED